MPSFRHNHSKPSLNQQGKRATETLRQIQSDANGDWNTDRTKCSFPFSFFPRSPPPLLYFVLLSPSLPSSLTFFFFSLSFLQDLGYFVFMIIPFIRSLLGSSFLFFLFFLFLSPQPPAGVVTLAIQMPWRFLSSLAKSTTSLNHELTRVEWEKEHGIMPGGTVLANA
ncbi:hypothetical protein HOY80DRAFT_994849 [Tuber brumale]|nr:hypothetical protein HOY80DRAFT_994849 [Tuber brumale]